MGWLAAGLEDMGVLVGGWGTQSACEVLWLTTCVFESLSFHIFSQGEGLGRASSLKMGREGQLGMRQGELAIWDSDMWFLFGVLHAEMVGLAFFCSYLHPRCKHPSDY